MTKIPAFLRRWGRDYLLRTLPQYGYELVNVRSRDPSLVGNLLEERLVLCNFCGTIFRRSGQDHSESVICPRCDAIARERVIYECVLREAERQTGESDLFFLGSTCLKRYKMLECSPRYNEFRRRIYDEALGSYVASDFDMKAHRADLKMDLTLDEDIEPYQDYFDIIVCSHVLEHIPDYRLALRNLNSLLAPGGFLILQVPVPESQYVSVTWDEFHQDNTRVYHRFGFDLLFEMDPIFRDAKAVVGLLDFEVTSPEVKADKFEMLKTIPERCVVFGEQSLISLGLGSPDICDAFIGWK
jgi:predicted SAM-dependent methyltransferase